MTPPADTMTKPDDALVVRKAPLQSPDIDLPTIVTWHVCTEPVAVFEHLLSDLPLHRPNRTRPIEDIEDELDIAAFEARKDDPGIPWEQVKDELGL